MHLRPRRRKTAREFLAQKAKRLRLRGARAIMISYYIIKNNQEFSCSADKMVTKR